MLLKISNVKVTKCTHVNLPGFWRSIFLALRLVKPRIPLFRYDIRVNVPVTSSNWPSMAMSRRYGTVHDVHKSDVILMEQDGTNGWFVLEVERNSTTGSLSLRSVKERPEFVPPKVKVFDAVVYANAMREG